MTTIREVLREAAIAVSLGAAFELIAGFSISASVVLVWALVNRGLI
jgi:hypothetical protein